ncbi:putative conserved membrane protein [Synechococcus sp. PROS-7-1]|nr:putative conserved membrane protein [Synechococcus sp. PROS-7-1]
MDPEPVFESTPASGPLVAIPLLVLLGFMLAVTGLGIPMAAVLSDRPSPKSSLVTKSNGSQGSFPISLSRTGQSSRGDSSGKSQ